MNIESPHTEQQVFELESRPLHTPPRKRSTRPGWGLLALAFLLVAAVFAGGVLPRVKARTALAKETSQMAIPVVAVAHPEPGSPAQELVLPANVQPYTVAPIYARTDGYLKKWYVDIGAHVKSGQLLAEIETPEVEQQLRQARANLATAEANLSLSKTTADRYEGLLKTNSVAQQETDNAVGSYKANQAIVDSNLANVQRLEALVSFQKIYAPFDGTITVRNTDVGALISSGSSGGPTTQLFQIAQPQKLRVYVNVPQAYSQAARPGMTAHLTLSEFPGRQFEGKLVRTAEAIDPATRTLLVEISVDNPTGTLFSGSYAEVHLKLPSSGSTYTIPVSALLFRSEGLQVVTVKDDKAQLVPVTAGRDYGDRLEIVAGLQGDESVMLNPPDAIISGQDVRIAQTADKQDKPAARKGEKK
jgi:RND family efflux transporter MFP subunit